MVKSKKEMQDQAITNGLEVDSIEPDYFKRERRENLKEQGYTVELIELSSMPQDQKDEYRRMKELERLEERRTCRRDRLEQEYDGGDEDATGDPELDAWLRGDWWVLPTEVDV